MLHEVFHKVQNPYGTWRNTEVDRKWITEGTARSIQDKICIGPTAADWISLGLIANSGYAKEVGNYLQDTNMNLESASYRSALFWTMAEQVCDLEGSNAERRQIDFIRILFEHHEAEPAKTGREVISWMLGECNAGLDFQDLFLRLVIANYAKDMPNAPAIYQYAYEAETPSSNYGPVAYSLNPDPGLPLPIFGGEQLVGDGSVQPWAAQYLVLTPDPGVSQIDISFDQDLNNTLYYHLLLEKGNDLVDEISDFGPDFDASFANDAYDRVTVVVAGLTQGDTFDYTVNVMDPQVRIITPVESLPANAGEFDNPRKNLVRVDVTDANAEKVDGIDPANAFTVRVGPELLDLSDEEVLIAWSYIQGQYWMVLRAPNQGADGIYGLQANYATTVDDETDAVIYGPVPQTSNLVAIDRSASMDDFEKMPAARDAGRLYLDVWDTGDEIGVVSFGTVDGVETDLELGLSDWTQDNRDTGHDGIDALLPIGLDTPIGQGLANSLAELTGKAADDHNWAIILLSDGMETGNALTVEDFLANYDALKDAGDKLPKIHTVALGPDADYATMESISSKTGGQFQYASNVPDEPLFGPTPLATLTPELFTEMADIYRAMSEDVGGQRRVTAVSGGAPSPARTTSSVWTSGPARQSSSSTTSKTSPHCTTT